VPAAIRLSAVGGVDRTIEGLFLSACEFGVVWEDSACVVTTFSVWFGEDGCYACVCM